MYSLVGIFLVPLILASANLIAKPPNCLMITDKRILKWLTRLGMILTFPLLPFWLIMSEAKTFMEMTYCDTKKFQDHLKRYKEVKIQHANFVKTELCMETSLQLTMSVLLLAFSKSTTRTSEGLEALFNSNEKILGFPPELFLVLNSCWSMFTAWRSYLKGLSASKNDISLTSKPSMILGIFVTLSVATKCLTTLHFLAPCLGLYHILRHFQGEARPFAAGVSFYSDGQVQLPNVDVSWEELSRYNYSDRLGKYDHFRDYNISQVGDFSLTANYTILSEELCLYSVWVLMAIETLLILIAKRLSNPKTFKKQSVLENVTHALQNCQIPAPLEDWDQTQGSIQSYKKAQLKVEHEIASTLAVNLLMNLIMCAPMIILCKKFHLPYSFE